MTIDADVAKKAAKWKLDPKLVQAVVIAEGNIVKAVQCSIPSVKTRDEALDVLCRSIVHRMMDFINASSNDIASDFIHYFGSFWAPINAENDPKGLNKNWVPNVLKLWGKL